MFVLWLNNVSFVQFLAQENKRIHVCWLKGYKWWNSEMKKLNKVNLFVGNHQENRKIWFLVKGIWKNSMCYNMLQSSFLCNCNCRSICFILTKIELLTICGRNMFWKWRKHEVLLTEIFKNEVFCEYILAGTTFVGRSFEKWLSCELISLNYCNVELQLEYLFPL